eukprot:15430115-Alexandrium_andersonii.AAC.1
MALAETSPTRDLGPPLVPVFTGQFGDCASSGAARNPRELRWIKCEHRFCGHRGCGSERL